MPRKNPLLFRIEEYQFLHKVLMPTESKSKFLRSIKEKRGMGLDQKEIDFVKKQFEKWNENPKNDLIWMR
tara:strand:- start:140 stop:349 length:210 start_codon:yes stop_codon:yes gene_type:complete